MQIGELSTARKDMKKIIEKQEAQKEILGMPLLSPDYGQPVGKERDISEIIDESEIQTKRLIKKPFLDFSVEEKYLRGLRQYEKTNDLGLEKEVAEEYIIKTYNLSKRKEHAFTNERLTDDNIKIFCGDIPPDKIDQYAMKGGIKK